MDRQRGKALTLWKHFLRRPEITLLEFIVSDQKIFWPKKGGECRGYGYVGSHFRPEYGPKEECLAVVIARD